MVTSQFLLEMQKIQSEENESLARKEELLRELSEVEAALRTGEERQASLKKLLNQIEGSSAAFVKRRNELLNLFNENCSTKETKEIPVESAVDLHQYPHPHQPPKLNVPTAELESESPKNLIIDLSNENQSDTKTSEILTNGSGVESVDTHAQESKTPFATFVKPALNVLNNSRNVTIESGKISVTRSVNSNVNQMATNQSGNQPQSSFVIDPSPSDPEKLKRKVFNPELERTCFDPQTMRYENADRKKRPTDKGDSGKVFKKFRRNVPKNRADYSEYDRINIEISLPVSGQSKGKSDTDESVYQSPGIDEPSRPMCSSSHSFVSPFSADIDLSRASFDSAESKRSNHLLDPRIARSEQGYKGVVGQEYLNEKLRVSETNQFSARSICFLKLIDEYLYVACKDGTVKRYRVTDYSDTINYLGQTDAARTVEVDLDHSLLFTGSKLGHFRCYKLHNGDHIESKFLKTQIQCIVNAWGKIFVALSNGNIIVLKYQNDFLRESDSHFKIKEKLITLSPVYYDNLKLMIVLLLNSQPLIVNSVTGQTIMTLYMSDLSFFPSYIETNRSFCVTVTGCTAGPLDKIKSAIHVYNPFQGWAVESCQKEPGVIMATCMHEQFLYAAIMIRGVTRIHCYSLPNLRVVWIAYFNQKRVFGLTVYSRYVLIGSESGEISTFSPMGNGPFVCYDNPCSCRLPFARPSDLEFHVSRYCR